MYQIDFASADCFQDRVTALLDTFATGTLLYRPTISNSFHVGVVINPVDFGGSVTLSECVYRRAVIVHYIDIPAPGFLCMLTLLSNCCRPSPLRLQAKGGSRDHG